MNNWLETTLSIIGNITTGKRPPIKVDVKDSYNQIPVYGGNGISWFTNKVLINYPVIVTGRVGTIGTVFKITEPCWVSDNAIIISPKENIDYNFLYYLILSCNILSLQKGSTQPLITQTDIGNIDVNTPSSLYEQRAIAAVLSALDDRIEANRKQNETLESMAAALFKSWFVDFEPFGGTMPDDWKIGTLSKIADIIMGQSPDGSSYNTEKDGIVFYQGRAEFGWRFPQNRLFTTQSKRMATKGDVLLSVRAPVGDINIADENCCIGRGLAAIHSKYMSFILYFMLAQKIKLEQFNGEGTVFGCINKDALHNLEAVIPTDKALSDFESICSIIDNKILNNEQQTRTLARIRNSLLPRLMSGKIRVPIESSGLTMGEIWSHNLTPADMVEQDQKEMEDFAQKTSELAKKIGEQIIPENVRKEIIPKLADMAKAILKSQIPKGDTDE